MYKNIVKMAKQIIAKGQFNKLVEYLVKDSQKSKQQCTIKVQQIQKQSFNFVWFTHRFVAQHKHYQDIEPLLKVQKAYKKLNKELRIFDFNDNKSFSDFHNFMENYLNKNVKNQDFKAPSYCKLIHSDGKYNYYYADAKDKKCYEDLHQCNTKQDGHQYAMWCVVNGTVSWGDYTTSQFPFYVYVTYKNNIPVMLFNFGYNSGAQIKDIHDDPFTKYDQELLNSIKQLAKKYNFDIAKNTYDFKTFNQTDELYNKQFDESNIDQNIISESHKYNGLNFIQQNIIYDFKKNKKAYLIANDNLINLPNYKIDINVLSLLKDSRQYDCIYKLADEKFIEHCSDVVLKFIIDFFVQNKSYYQLNYLIKDDKIKDEKLFNQIVQLFIQNSQCGYLNYLIKDDKIKDEKLFNQIVQCFIDNKECDRLYYLIKYDKIKDEKIINQIVQLFIQNSKCNQLDYLIKDDKIKDEKLFNQIVQCFIDNKESYYLIQLIKNDKIKDEKLFNQIVQVLIDKKEYVRLCALILFDKTKDKNQIKEIVQVLIDNKVCDRLYKLIENDKIKDEKLFNQIIQCFIDNKEYKHLYSLITDDKIKDEKTINQIVQLFVQNSKCNQLGYLIQYDKIKDEKVINQIFQVLIQNKQYYQLHILEIKYPELTKKIEDAKNSSNVKVSHICRELLDIAKSIR